MDAITVLHAGMIRWQRDNTPPNGFPSDTPKWREYEVTRPISEDTVLNEFMSYQRYADNRAEQPASGIIVGNWNKIPQRYQNYLERKGFELEWSDGVDSCDDCGHLVQTQPDCWFWRPDYWFSDSGTTCNKCTDWGEVLESKQARQDGVNTWQCEPREHGWYLLGECYSHDEGSNLAETLGYRRYVVLRGRSDVTREVWVKGESVDVPLSNTHHAWDITEIQLGAPL